MKCPLDLDLSKRLLSFTTYYGKENLIHAEVKTKKPIVTVGTEYWIGEDYRIVDGLIQYKADLYKKELPEWISSKSMKQGSSRFSIVIVNITETKIQELDKNFIKLLNIPDKNLPYYVGEHKEKDSSWAKKSEMLWRLKCYWENIHGDQAWDKNDDIWVYEFSIKRNVPETYKNYLAVNWYEKINT